MNPEKRCEICGREWTWWTKEAIQAVWSVCGRQCRRRMLADQRHAMLYTTARRGR